MSGCGGAEAVLGDVVDGVCGGGVKDNVVPPVEAFRERVDGVVVAEVEFGGGDENDLKWRCLLAPGVDVRLGREFAGLGEVENCTVLFVRICVEGVV